jgi:hypothetical protein
MALMNKRHFILSECFFLETLLCALNPLKTQTTIRKPPGDEILSPQKNFRVSASPKGKEKEEEETLGQ